MSTATPTSLRDALARFRQANGLRAEDAVHASWTCRVGPITLVLPNFAWRRKAIEAHDLHHVLTGYPCTMSGEFEMAAWEFGAGGMPHWAARLFCLPLVTAGLVWAPRRIFRAFIAGRRSCSLHGTKVSEQVLAAPAHLLRAELTVRRNTRRFPDGARFAFLILRAGLVSLSPIALPIGLWLVWRAL